MKKLTLLLVAACGFSFTSCPSFADDPVVPGDGVPASHYETLWTKSPFAVASAEEVEDSPDYSLVGVTQLEGVAYASIIERQTQDHFLITSEKATKGLTLKTITRGSGASADTFATVDKDGQILTLKLEAAPIAAPAPGVPGAPGAPGEQPGAPPIMVPPVTQNIPMPGANMPPPAAAFNGGGSTRFIRIHRPTIHVPPMPGQTQQQPAPNTPVPAAPGAPPTTPDQVQSHNPPPNQ